VPLIVGGQYYIISLVSAMTANESLYRHKLNMRTFYLCTYIGIISVKVLAFLVFINGNN